MPDPTFTLVYTPTRTLGVWSDGRVCEMREIYEGGQESVYFVALGHADRAALWPETAANVPPLVHDAATCAICNPTIPERAD
mgnify:CR=1 FL=1